MNSRSSQSLQKHFSNSSQLGGALSPRMPSSRPLSNSSITNRSKLPSSGSISSIKSTPVNPTPTTHLSYKQQTSISSTKKASSQSPLEEESTRHTAKLTHGSLPNEGLPSMSNFSSAPQSMGKLPTSSRTPSQLSRNFSRDSAEEHNFSPQFESSEPHKSQTNSALSQIGFRLLETRSRLSEIRGDTVGAESKAGHNTQQTGPHIQRTGSSVSRMKYSTQQFSQLAQRASPKEVPSREDGGTTHRPVTSSRTSLSQLRSGMGSLAVSGADVSGTGGNISGSRTLRPSSAVLPPVISGQSGGTSNGSQVNRRMAEDGRKSAQVTSSASVERPASSKGSGEVSNITSPKYDRKASTTSSRESKTRNKDSVIKLQRSHVTTPSESQASRTRSVASTAESKSKSRVSATGSKASIRSRGDGKRRASQITVRSGDSAKDMNSGRQYVSGIYIAQMEKGSTRQNYVKRGVKMTESWTSVKSSPAAEPYRSKYVSGLNIPQMAIRATSKDSILQSKLNTPVPNKPSATSAEHFAGTSITDKNSANQATSISPCLGRSSVRKRCSCSKLIGNSRSVTSTCSNIRKTLSCLSYEPEWPCLQHTSKCEKSPKITILIKSNPCNVRAYNVIHSNQQGSRTRDALDPQFNLTGKTTPIKEIRKHLKAEEVQKGNNKSKPPKYIGKRKAGNGTGKQKRKTKDQNELEAEKAKLKEDRVELEKEKQILCNITRCLEEEKQRLEMEEAKIIGDRFKQELEQHRLMAKINSLQANNTKVVKESSALALEQNEKDAHQIDEQLQQLTSQTDTISNPMDPRSHIHSPKAPMDMDNGVWTMMDETSKSMEDETWNRWNLEKPNNIISTNRISNQSTSQAPSGTIEEADSKDASHIAEGTPKSKHKISEKSNTGNSPKNSLPEVATESQTPADHYDIENESKNHQHFWSTTHEQDMSYAEDKTPKDAEQHATPDKETLHEQESSSAEGNTLAEDFGFAFGAFYSEPPLGFRAGSDIVSPAAEDEAQHEVEVLTDWQSVESEESTIASNNDVTNLMTAEHTEPEPSVITATVSPIAVKHPGENNGSAELHDGSLPTLDKAESSDDRHNSEPKEEGEDYTENTAMTMSKNKSTSQAEGLRVKADGVEADRADKEDMEAGGMGWENVETSGIEADGTEASDTDDGTETDGIKMEPMNTEQTQEYGIEIEGGKRDGIKIERAEAKESVEEGVEVDGMETERAEVDATEIEGEEIDGPEMEWAEVVETEIEEPEVDGTEIEGSDVYGTEIEGEKVNETEIEGVEVDGAEGNYKEMEGAGNYEKEMQRAEMDGTEPFKAGAGEELEAKQDMTAVSSDGEQGHSTVDETTPEHGDTKGNEEKRSVSDWEVLDREIDYDQSNEAEQMDTVTDGEGISGEMIQSESNEELKQQDDNMEDEIDYSEEKDNGEE